MFFATLDLNAYSSQKQPDTYAEIFEAKAGF